MAKAKKLPSGNWRCRAYYTDEEGNYKSKSFTADTKKQAELKVAQFLMEREHARKPENKTIGELIDRFIDIRSNLLSPSTVIGYRKIGNTAFQDIVDLRVGFLTKDMYQKSVNDYAKSRSPKTVLSAHALFNSVLKENNIHIAEKAILPQKQREEIEIPTTEEIIEFLKYTRNTRLHLLVLFAVYMGLRRSEIIALKWKDIDFKNKTVLINKARVKDEFGQYIEKTTKTYSGTRRLHLPQALMDELPQAGLPDEYIIQDSIDALDSLYKRTKVKANFPYRFHALRHYNASIMLQIGMPNKYAQERMGHSTENMLKNVYQHTFKSKQEEYDLELDNFFNSAIAEKALSKDNDGKET